MLCVFVISDRGYVTLICAMMLTQLSKGIRLK